ncbi:hypothetical protein PPMP20_20625 [Paraburkholderia phymatum]|uniref:Uncharacterized protein n=1 Tax=Paraburkholderia phymatum (strain DSM 17167 / CIP 108236 / LMG 21445 / STM815) TaxID=391038 RepID=B2JG08_PARP8|nr:hypothetical protein [Paraburkholderia phymatum]ACC70090.1 conserved hypothetical protein [Paraburkholderia phymatum STM815]
MHNPGAKRATNADFAPLYATGKPFWGNCGCYRTVGAIDNVLEDRLRPDAITRFLGGAMDLAMAMSVALFGMFTGSTIYFFYKFAR